MLENLKSSETNQWGHPTQYSAPLLKVPRRPILFYQKRDRFLNRTEDWGSIVYDFKGDAFSAKTKGSSYDILPASPLSIYWLVVAPCNLRCIHCYGNVEEMPGKSLSEIEQLQVADEIIESGAMRVTLAGGEPLLRKDTPDIIEKLADNNVSVVLGTNGSFLHPSILNSVKKTTLVEISLDSHLESVNNAIRVSRSKTGNAFRETLKALQLCVENNIKVKVLTCLNKHNYQHIEPLAELLHKIGIRIWGLSWTLHAGRAKSIYSTYMPVDQDTTGTLVDKVRSQYPDMTIKYSNRTDISNYNRFSCLLFPNGHIFAEDVVLGKKVPFHSILERPLVHCWSEQNFDIRQHFKRWVGNRIVNQGEHNV